MAGLGSPTATSLLQSIYEHANARPSVCRNHILHFGIIAAAMVNHGRSGGCVTCRQRRVKCDEAKPECRQCQRLRLRCGGYKAKYANLKFKDQNHKFYTGRVAKVQGQQVVRGPRALSEPDTAVPFFLRHYASMGRDMGSTRGFFEMLIPVYPSQPQGSALSLAVSAVSSELLSMWRRGPRSFQSPHKGYALAVSRLRSATQDPIERRKPATVLAALVLQYYENFTAVYGLRLASSLHHNGAASLLPFADSDDINGTIGAYMGKFLLHTEISSAMRQKRPLRSIAYHWIESKDIMTVPANPSSALDAIMASVVELQASYTQLAAQGSSTPSLPQFWTEWRTQAQRIDEQLLAWARNVPDHWQPLQLTSEDIDPSISAYRSVCEVYPSCQIASIWNLWHVQRVLLAKITLGSLNMFSNLGQVEPDCDQLPDEIEDFVRCTQTIQEMLDSVCYSIPFYLGNRTTRSTMADFTDPAISFPSYHSLASGDKRRRSRENHDSMMSRDEHRRHAIAQGPWRAMHPLSRLLTLFFEDQGQVIASCLRAGQHEWISEQFLRIATLLHLPSAWSDNREGCTSSAAQGAVNVKAEHLAREIRKGAILMSGP